MGYFDRLRALSASRNTLVCVGLDPDPDHIEGGAAGALRHCREVVRQTEEHACCFKPNSAFWEQYGPDGWAALMELREATPGTPFLFDAKRGDMGNTMRAYARAVFETMGMDAATVNPYMGTDSIEEFARYGDRGVYVVCRSSNPGASDLQHLEAGGRAVYLHVAALADRLNSNGNLGLVVGATAPAEIAEVRRHSALPFLIPGVGAQGGDVDGSVRGAWNGDPASCLVSSSRGVLFAKSPAHAAEELEDPGQRGSPCERVSEAAERRHTARLVLTGHIIDSMILPQVMDMVMDLGGNFTIDELKVGQHKTDTSLCRMEVVAGSAEQLDRIVRQARALGATAEAEQPARTDRVSRDGVFPEGFYSTSNLPTEILVDSRWVRVEKIEMDCAIAVDRSAGRAWCIVFQDAKPGMEVVIGHQGVRVTPQERSRHTEIFSFMGSEVSAEKPKKVLIGGIAEEMRQIRESGGRILVVGRPGRGPHGSGPVPVTADRAGFRPGPFRGQRARRARRRVRALRHCAGHQHRERAPHRARARAPHARDQPRASGGRPATRWSRAGSSSRA